MRPSTMDLWFINSDVLAKPSMRLLGSSWLVASFVKLSRHAMHDSLVWGVVYVLRPTTSLKLAGAGYSQGGAVTGVPLLLQKLYVLLGAQLHRQSDLFVILIVVAELPLMAIHTIGVDI